MSQENFILPLSLSLCCQCSVLLFIIGGDTLSVGSMVEVSYYIGCGRRLVLVLNDIPYPEDDNNHTTLEGMEVSTHHEWCILTTPACPNLKGG